MKTTHIIIVFFAMVTVSVSGQTTISAGLGYTGEGSNAHGIVLELERDRVFAEGFSLPTRLDLSFQSAQNYYASYIFFLSGDIRLNSNIKIPFFLCDEHE